MDSVYPTNVDDVPSSLRGPQCKKAFPANLSYTCKTKSSKCYTQRLQVPKQSEKPLTLMVRVSSPEALWPRLHHIPRGAGMPSNTAHKRQPMPKAPSSPNVYSCRIDR